MLAIRGARSRIAQELIRLVPHEDVISVARNEPMPLGGCRYLFCAGLIRPRRLEDQTPDEIAESIYINYASIVKDCDRLLAANDRARIAIVGSESGFSGSYDGAYAKAKADVHAYVNTKKLQYERQQLVCVAPGIVGDAGMTLRRTDLDTLGQRMARHPKGRFVSSMEVARALHFLLYVDRGYITNHVIRMNGGEHLK